MLNKKIFLSHPMTGKSKEEIYDIREQMKEWATMWVYPHVEVIDSYLDLGDVGPLVYIAKSVELLDQADIVIVHPDWIFSRGCKLEVDAALMYGKHDVHFIKNL